jgi:hypothetical protein
LKRLIRPAAGGMAGGGCAAFLYLVNPSSHRVFFPCPFRALTGLYCPACGGLRMVHDLLHGHLAAAAHDNAVAIVAVGLGLAAWLTWSIRCLQGRPAPGRPAWLSPAIIAVMIIWAVVRNIPAFTALRPVT